MAVEQLTTARAIIDSGQFLTIAGPCSVDTEGLARITVDQAVSRSIPAARIDLYKPRTDPFNADGTLAFTGAQEKGLPWLRMALQKGVIPATEVMMPDQAIAAIDAVRMMPNPRLILWNGARDTNQEVVRRIGQIIGQEKQVHVEYLIKCPWAADGKAWKGLVNWAKAGGAREEQLLMCYSGVLPSEVNQLDGDRRSHSWQWALDQRKDGVPMLFDPSHIGFTPKRIEELTREALTYPFQGTLLEVHPFADGLYPNKSLTDPGISWNQLDQIQIPGLDFPARTLNGHASSAYGNLASSNRVSYSNGAARH